MLPSEELEAAFERAMEVYLRLGAHERRGLSAAEYRERCRRLWDACPTSDDFPFKTLVDKSLELPEILPEAKMDYDDHRVRQCVDLVGIDADLYCLAGGLFRKDGTPVALNTKTNTPREDPPEPQHERVILALFDVLGFEARLDAVGLAEVLSTYRLLLDRVLFVDDLRCTSLHQRGDGTYCPAMFTLPVKYAYFSDTLLLWVPLTQVVVAPFLARCADLACEAVALGVPIRGAIAIGEAVLHRPSGTYLGMPLVEAARLEAAQEWLGVGLARSTMWPPFAREADPRLVFPIVPPHKPGTESRVSGVVLDWPRRWREKRDVSALEALARMNTVPQHAKYYENAAKFVVTSSQHEDWCAQPSTQNQSLWEAEPAEFVEPYSGAMAAYDDTGNVVVTKGTRMTAV